MKNNGYISDIDRIRKEYGTDCEAMYKRIDELEILTHHLKRVEKMLRHDNKSNTQLITNFRDAHKELMDKWLR